MDFDETWLEAEVYRALQDVLFCFCVREPGRAQRGDPTQKQAQTELGSTQRAQTWSVGIFFQARINGMVYFLIAPSVRVVNFVTESQKWALMELRSTLRAQTWSAGIFIHAHKMTWFIFW